MSNQAEADSSPFDPTPQQEKHAEKKAKHDERSESMEYSEGPQPPEKNTASPFNGGNRPRGGSGNNSNPLRDRARNNARSPQGGNANGSNTAQSNGSLHYTSRNDRRTTDVKISGGNLGNVIVGPQNVNLTSQQDVFQPGSHSSQFNIGGGNFVNSTIGGSANYNVTNVDGGDNGTKSYEVDGRTAEAVQKLANSLKRKEKPDTPKSINIKKEYSPEQVTLQLLQKNITAEDIVTLLKKNYKVENLAFASDDMLKNLCRI